MERGEERYSLVDDGLHLSGFEQRPNITIHILSDLGLVLLRSGTESGAGDHQPLQKNRVERDIDLVGNDRERRKCT